MCDEFEAGWQRDERPSLESCIAQFDDADRSEAFAELLPLDLEYRRDRGETPTRDEYLQRFSAFEPIIRSCFEEQASSETIKPGGTQPNSLPPMKLPSGKFGNYELLEEIARGGMGVVYKARQLGLNRTVAVKMILGGPVAAQPFIERFLAEAQTAARLQHPGIVVIVEVGQCEGQHFFSMEYLQGKTLAELIKPGPLPATKAAKYALAVAEAVAYAHEHGVLHRDLKPSNVMVDAADRVKVMDFGLARQVAGSSQLTHSGEVLGTPSYMSPEQASGKTSLIDNRSDVYSIGAILYELLTGRPPFQGESPIATLLQVLQSKLTPPRRINDQIDLQLERIVLKCLAKDAGKRYATATELADELRTCLAQLPVVQPQAGGRRRSRKWGLAAAALALFALAAAYTIRVQTAEGEVVIECRDPDIKIEIQRDGKSVKEMTLAKGKNTATIGVGDVQVAVTGANSDEYVVASESTKLLRGGQVIFTIEKRPPATTTSSTKKPVEPPATKQTPEEPLAAGELDRAVANWVISAGGHATLVLADSTVVVGPGQKLPSGLFYVKGINFGPGLAPLDLAEFARLPKLKLLNDLAFVNCNLTDEAVEQIARCRQIVTLSVSDEPKLTDVDIALLKNLEQLRFLDLSGLRITGSAAEKFGNLKMLRTLRLSGTDLQPSAAKVLASLPRLSLLDLNFTTFHEDFLPALSSAPRLRELSLDNTNITDTGLESLARLAELRVVSLWNTKVSAEGVSKLKDHPYLSLLNLQQTSVNEADLTALRAAAPHWMIAPEPADPASDAKNQAATTRWALEQGTPPIGVYLLRPTSKLYNYQEAASVPARNVAVSDLSWRRAPKEPKELARLGNLRQLRSLHILETWTKTDENLLAVIEPLVPRSCLTSIFIYSPPTTLTQRSLSVITEHPLIDTMRLPVDDWTVAEFSQLRKLKYLYQLQILSDISDQKFWDVLGDLPELERLELQCPALATTNLGALSRLPELRHLGLTFVRIADLDLAVLEGLPNLRSLNLIATPVTDVGLEQLARCRQLTFLNLRRAQVTAAGVAAFQTSLPQCIVLWDGAWSKSATAAKR
jgi:serine/threonine protein kinase/Leucine-rich repeat (LRR) protein